LGPSLAAGLIGANHVKHIGFDNNLRIRDEISGSIRRMDRKIPTFPHSKVKILVPVRDIYATREMKVLPQRAPESSTDLGPFFYDSTGIVLTDIALIEQATPDRKLCAPHLSEAFPLTHNPRSSSKNEL
jgi:hypothetical protein